MSTTLVFHTDMQFEFTRTKALIKAFNHKMKKFNDKPSVRKIVKFYKTIAAYHLLFDIIMFIGYASIFFIKVI